MTSHVAFGAVGASVFMIAAGCGGEDRSSESPPAKGVSAQAWASGFCSTVTRLEYNNKKRAVVLLRRVRDAQDIAKAKADLNEVMANATKTADAELEYLRRTGPPAVEHGAEIQATVEDAWRQLRVAYATYQVKVRQLEANSPTALQRRMKSLDPGYNAEIDRIGSTIDKLEEADRRSDELDSAVHDETACNSPIFRWKSGPAPNLAALIRGLITGEL
jgi:hypothetical protein